MCAMCRIGVRLCLLPCLLLQGELLQQMAVNRARLGVVLQAALDDMPQHAQRTAQFASWEEEINAYHAVWRELGSGRVEAAN